MNEPKISVTVDAPEGLPNLRPSLFVEPKTHAEFDAVVEAMGGPCAFRPDTYSGNSATADLPGGGWLHLSAPTGEKGVNVRPPLCPSIQALADGCER